MKKYELLARAFRKRTVSNQLSRVLKTTTFLLLIGCLHLSAASWSQTVTLRANRQSLKQVFETIEKQTGYWVVYSDQLINRSKPITIRANGMALNRFLDQILEPQALTYTIEGKNILVMSSNERTLALKNMLTGVADIKNVRLQQRVIRGKVTDEGGNPLQSVTVTQKNTKNGVLTDREGNYEMSAHGDDIVLVFTIIGYVSNEQVVGGRSTVDVALAESVSDLDEVVVVGYGTQRKRDLTGAITRIDGAKFETQSATSVSEYFSGTVAGISSTQGTGAGGGGSLEIRGRNSLKAGSSPLIVLDGVIYNGSLQDINPFDIANIDVLQDASAAAVYGARAASGVIIVTTKRGKSEVPTITLSAMTGLASVSHDYKPFDAQGFLQFREDLMNQMAPSDNLGFYARPDQLPDGVSLADWRAYSNNPNADDMLEWANRIRLNDAEIESYQQGRVTDWYDMRMQQGLRQNYDVALAGKGARVNYYLSTGYTDNEGIVYGQRLKTWRTRLNLEGQVANFLKVGLNSQFASQDGSSVAAGGITALSPYGRFKDESGALLQYPHEDPLFPNPFLDAYYKDQYVRNNRLFATLYAEFKLPFGFKYRFSFQNRLDITKDYNFWPTTTIQGGRDRQNGYGSRVDGHGYEWMIDNIVSWNKTFGQHGFDFTFLANAEKLQIQRSRQENENFGPNGSLTWHGLQYGINPSILNDDMLHTGDALMFRLNYNFDERYLLTLSWRRDGFSAFGQNHPRGVFPSTAFAWRLSEERFFHASWVDDLKLRFSWGINGNRDIPTYSALSNLSPNPYFDGTSVVVGLTNSSMANPNLKWEGTEAYNIGFDLTTLDGRLSATVDAYRGTTLDLLLDRKLPRVMGYEFVTANLGKLSNRGINATINGQLLKNERITWSSDLVFSLNRNRIDRLWGDMVEETVDGKTTYHEAPDYANGWFPGEAIDRVWDYRILGIWQEEDAEDAAVYGLRPGEYRAADVNDDGAYGQFDDKQFLGWKEPRYTFGWRNDITFLKQFDASIFLRADLGHIGARGDFNHPNSNTYDRSNALDIPYWTSENRSNSYPRLNVNYRLFEGGINIYEPRSFLRIQDASVGYRVPADLLNRVSVDRLRFFVSARNLLTVTSWTGWDPESGSSPMPRIFTLGLNASF
ncbi:SusC/RagA family TonB-linked outer membrane protein [Parapedobacter soli]|uniref:SusC/RagA family TonB-linked outer membrane protein n=1 Tax=Parapedobacter soli TaxID=416955 RepID=UPI0021C69AD9|nr:SusC/RagA family TonB-linked outer membrane protein [Parapedobacter soli]